MALHKYRVLEQGLAAGWAPLAETEVGAEIELDFHNPDTGLNHEQAAIAAGWVERVDVEKKPKGAEK